MNKSSKLSTIEQKILESALMHAPQTGWNDMLVQNVKNDIGVSDFIKHCPDDIKGITDLFANWADREMLTALTSMDIESLKIRQRIYHGVKSRLEALSPHKDAFKASMKYMMRPTKAVDLHKIGWRTADRLWWAAGDTAADYNHYTKRILLSGVFASTTLFWLKDTSKDYEKTWDFLDKRIENVLKIGGAINKLKKRA